MTIRRNTFRPCVEQLEDRRLLAATLSANLTSGVLTIDGTENADLINVRQVNGRVSVDGISIRVGAYQQTSVAASVVNRIRVNGLGGNDMISLNSEAVAGQQPLAMAAHLFGGEGHDTIRGGHGADWIYGGNGSDAIYGNKGNDTLVAEAGADVVHGDDGDDRIWGGTSDDLLYGGNGNDTIYGEDGNDTLDGGAGLDLTSGGAGFDSYRDDFNLAAPFLNGAQVSDIVQQGSPICATLSSLSAMAKSGWNLQGLVTYQGNGLYDVRLRTSGGLVTQRVAFNGTWNDNDAAPTRDAQGRNTPEFWTLLFQRARLQLFGVDYRKEVSSAQWNQANVNSQYLLFDPGEALYNFTGTIPQYIYANQANPQTLLNALQAGRPVVLTTPGSGSNGTLDAATGIVAWHAYTLVGMTQSGGQWHLQLYNPWGVDGNGSPKDGKNDGFLTIPWSTFATYFRSARIV